MKKIGKDEIVPVLFLTIVVCISVILLSVADAMTRDIIEEQKRKEIEKTLKEHFPDLTDFEYDGGIEVYTVLKDNETIGYAFLAEGKGYGGTIEILVSITEDMDSINSISIITQMETPGLGAKTEESFFTDRFKGVAIDDVKLSKEGGKIDAITGATISSTAVVKAVRTTALQKVKLIEEREDP